MEKKNKNVLLHSCRLLQLSSNGHRMTGFAKEESASVFTIAPVGSRPIKGQKSCIGQKCKILCANVLKASASTPCRSLALGPHWGTSDPTASLAVLSGNESLCFNLWFVLVTTSAAHRTFGRPRTRGTDSCTAG